MFTHGNLVLCETLLVANVLKEEFVGVVQRSSWDNWVKVLFVMALVVGFMGGFFVLVQRLTRDAVGRTTTASIDGDTDAYLYDVNGRLLSVTRNGTLLESYGWDDNGNRTSMLKSGVTTTASFDDQDRIVARDVDGAVTAYSYNARGQLKERTGPEGTTEFTYDELGANLGVALSDGRRVEYVLDGNRRRAAKQVDGVTTTVVVPRSKSTVSRHKAGCT
jgi:YD repeat-containing protein